MFEKILVCLDGSALAEQILPYVTEMAGFMQSQLVLLQVITVRTVVTEPTSGGDVPLILLDEVEREKLLAQEYLEGLAEPLRHKGLDVVYSAIQGIPAGQAIVEFAQESEIGLIALATHGRSGLGRAVYGSVAEFVLRESHLPILLIKPKKKV